MKNRIGDNYRDINDDDLVRLSINGNKDALNSLINKHKDMIFNIAVRMTGNTVEAEDLSQEIFLKIITKLSTFKFKSNFKTWIYRITVNHFLNMKKLGKESVFESFDKHHNFFENIPDSNLENNYSTDSDLLVEETKIECMTGMLLCLNSL